MRDTGLIGLVIVTHGRLAHEFAAALEHVVGAQPALRAIAIGPADDMEARRREIADAVEEVDSGAGVIVLTDMFGGTPSNLAISLIGRPGVEVIAGLNLPVLVKLASVRSSLPLDRAVLAAQEAGRKYLTVASSILGEPAA